MHAFRCPRCRGIAYIEALNCPMCDLPIGVEFTSSQMLPFRPEGVEHDGVRWVGCVNRSWSCNWLVDADDGDARCFACRITRRRPDAHDTIALEKLAVVDQDKRRMLLRLTALGLPVTPWYERPGGLGFDLLSSRSGNGPVPIGHANGIITIDLAESLDAHRERLRVQLGEPYRTMLGHFRHEVGHYYEWVLVEQTDWIEPCRELFGDERVSYADAIQRHYRLGAPPGWQDSYISEYATMHPWEDFAETWAHYLHITDTLGTLAAAGIDLAASRYPELLERDVVPRASYHGVSMDVILHDWYWCSKLLNRANRAMGKGDLYPFRIVPTVARKLAFVHRVVEDAADRTHAEWADRDDDAEVLGPA